MSVYLECLLRARKSAAPFLCVRSIRTFRENSAYRFSMVLDSDDRRHRASDRGPQMRRELRLQRLVGNGREIAADARRIN